MKLRPGICALLAALAAAGSGIAAPAPVVTVEGGKVSGVATTVLAYKDIPFAAPPVGDLRWRPPAPVKPWTGIKDGSKFGNACPQDPALGGNPQPQSEDCLNLNVWAPKNAKNAPVMVWIHGGGLVAGAGFQEIYDGESFARDGVIMVNINYRLNALGFFAHPALTKAAPRGEAIGNYGAMDQLAALKWVQRNIRAFGGDPKNVTVFGESAGGQSTLYLLAMPQAKGLFARAISESGPGLSRSRTLAKAEQEGLESVTHLGLGPDATLAQLRALPPEAFKIDYMTMAPILDGQLITDQVMEMIAQGRGPQVPAIIGNNSDEGSQIGKVYPNGPKRVWDRMGAAKATLRAAYRDEVTDDTLDRVAYGDVIYGAPARWIAKARRNAPTYLYRFDYVDTERRGKIPGANHIFEVMYVFVTQDRWRIKPSAEDLTEARFVHACWVGFAKTGAPGCPNTPWPAYTPTSEATMVFDHTGNRAIKGFRKPIYDVIESAVFPKLDH